MASNEPMEVDVRIAWRVLVLQCVVMFLTAFCGTGLALLVFR